MYLEIWVENNPNHIDILAEDARLLSDDWLDLKVNHMYSIGNSGVMYIETKKGAK